MLQEHTPDLMRLPGVVGTAESLHEGSPCIVVMVASSSAELEAKLPKQLEGYLVKVWETGEIKAREGGA